MDVSLVIKQRLEQLGLEQRDLAIVAQVTESYISQLLTRKKPPPAPNRTDIYDKMEKSLKLPRGELSKLADLQRKEELKRKWGDLLSPLFKEVRELILRKCRPSNRQEIRAIFEKQPFGELERLVTQKLLDVVKRVAKEELGNEQWLRAMARRRDQRYEDVRVMTLDFLDTDVFNLSAEHCASFLEPLVDSWEMNLATFDMQIVLNRRLVSGPLRKFEFVEREPEERFDHERGFKEFLQDASLSADVTEEEIAFLKKLRFEKKRPTRLYYYRELQNLRDPLHFRAG